MILAQYNRNDQQEGLSNKKYNIGIRAPYNVVVSCCLTCDVLGGGEGWWCGCRGGGVGCRSTCEVEGGQGG